MVLESDEAENFFNMLTGVTQRKDTSNGVSIWLCHSQGGIKGIKNVTRTSEFSIKDVVNGPKWLGYLTNWITQNPNFRRATFTIGGTNHLELYEEKDHCIVYNINSFDGTMGEPTDYWIIVGPLGDDANMRKVYDEL